ncbi:coniferyl-aldehyde dehydrogenase [Saccharospirillum sp. MSK14-1]|uniref:coniferyl aldehyde dehydrogenase n=1 Tax=Saccharospirillum sp. MSK14-1 TaxID=1897632 RepID=UPI000D3AD472|nr:coniferyl aldehyde dehydrogenase [Saccharospirillum sp. MSK14-1]PTY39053.1 coniferyl-aldehyde dehydrogenase [Saccharospirillum sp. MSK14-1]
MADLNALFDTQRRAFAQQPYPSLAERKHRLRQLKRLILDNETAIAEALNADFGGRAFYETRYAEVLPAITNINHTLRSLRRWMKPQRRLLHWLYQPATGGVWSQPLGVVGIMVPWNYGLLLSCGPLISALAAGNRCMIKLSELTPRYGELMAQLIARYFSADEVVVINGERDVAQAFSALPFDHLVFTGSTAVGRHIMTAAAANLTPVTLELGGKSPVWVDPSIPVDEAARRMVFTKCTNAGQTCVAPDYVLCPPDRIEAFTHAYLAEVKRQYGDDPRLSPDYSAIINARQHQRLTDYLKQVQQAGGQLHWAGPAPDLDDTDAKLPPVVLTGVDPESGVMQDEIFGPLLPVLPCTDAAAAVEFINQRPRPLALYVFGYARALKPLFRERTHSGSMMFNDALIQVAQDNLPFGGVGASGMGNYHDRAGFERLSHMRSVMVKGRWSSMKLVYPPYGRWIHRLIQWIVLR